MNGAKFKKIPEGNLLEVLKNTKTYPHVKTRVLDQSNFMLA